MTYSEKLKDPRWQKRRLEIMNRDGFKCCKCGDATKTLNVHHKRYRKGKEPWEYSSDDLMTLCEPCHKNEHKISGTLSKEDMERILRFYKLFDLGKGGDESCDYFLDKCERIKPMIDEWAFTVGYSIRDWCEDLEVLQESAERWFGCE